MQRKKERSWIIRSAHWYAFWTLQDETKCVLVASDPRVCILFESEEHEELIKTHSVKQRRADSAETLRTCVWQFNGICRQT